MTDFLGIAVLGLFLGMRHATDSDHVIAITTIVARQRTAFGAAAIGAAWGVGHTLTILVVGGGIILFGWVIPPRVGLSMEFSVGLMLVALGLANLMRQRSVTGLAATAAAGTPAHAPLTWLDQRFDALGGYRLVRPLFVGVVHGLAGSAAVALLVLTTIRNPSWALLYLVIFGLGTIAGMVLVTAVIALPLAHDEHRLFRLSGGFRFASGLLSLGFGLFVAYKIGFIDGLFTAHPHWNPE